MIYPSVGQYTEAIKLAEQSPEDYFATLTTLRPVLDEDNNPVMSSGNFAVVFKMIDQNDGKFYALKCFTRDQEGRDDSYRLIADELQDVSSDYLTKIQYLDKELFVDTNTDDNEFPVLLMDWVEGETLDKYVRKHIGDQYTLSMLAYKFSKLAMWLITQPFAHGDLKPDNILVRKDGSLVLVDYDGMYVPAMKGQKSRELGSPDFRHPLRTEDDFDEHIDDFSLSTILLSLKAISLQPSLLEEYGAADRLLFSERDYRNISESKVLDSLKPLMQDSELSTLLSLFIIASTQNNLSQVSSRLFCLEKSKKEDYSEEILSTEVTDEDIANGVEDEFGVVYSKDGKKLLCCKNEKLEKYIVKEGTKIICDWAFNKRKDYDLCWITNKVSIKSITLPNSLSVIGKGAFSGCTLLENVTMPDTIYIVREDAFCWCTSLQNCELSSNISSIEDASFWGCKSLNHIILPNNIRSIGDSAFKDSGLLSIIIPDSVMELGIGVFWNCKFLHSITLSNNVQTIKQFSFEKCSSLQELVIPDSVTSIEPNAFTGCRALHSITLSNNLKSIGHQAFLGCLRLKVITISRSVTQIGEEAFGLCESLHTIVFHSRFLTIAENVFEQCTALNEIIVPQQSVTKFRKMLKTKYAKLLVAQNEESSNATLF